MGRDHVAAFYYVIDVRVSPWHPAAGRGNDSSAMYVIVHVAEGMVRARPHLGRGVVERFGPRSRRSRSAATLMIFGDSLWMYATGFREALIRTGRGFRVAVDVRV